MIQVRTEEKNLALKIDIDSDIPRSLYGDELRIKQCVINLLSNAVKYTPEGTVSFAVGYEKCEDNDREILLKFSVTDTGCGIRQEDIDKLFIAFKRLEEKRNRHIEGSGLGLSITQSLLSLMGSTLAVESEYGKGSTFSFVVRQEVKGEDKVGEYEEAFRIAMESRGGYRQSFTAPDARILVVDDTPLNLSVFTSLLKATKVGIDTAESGSECLRMCVGNSYDVVFIDHMMPDMDGIVTLHELKALKDNKNAETPIICLTANAISGMREMFLSEGFTDYLAKPIDFVRLEQMLLKYIPKEKIEADYVEDSDDGSSLPDAVHAIVGLNAQNGVSHFGNAESYLNTLRMYSEAAEKNIEEIRNLAEAKDYKNLTVKIHSLKSTSGVVGAYAVSELAAELEEAGKKDTLAERGDDVERLIMMYSEMTKRLKPVLGDAKEEAGTETVAATNRSILLVDDDPLYQKMVRGWLADKYAVTALKSGKQALAYLNGHTPDLILLDCEMPEMNGVEVFNHIRQNESTADIPIIFLTGSPGEEGIQLADGQAAEGHLLKNMNRDEIVNAIDNFFKKGNLYKDTEEQA